MADDFFAHFFEPPTEVFNKFDIAKDVTFSYGHRDEGTVIIGATRKGKSTLLLRMIEQDMYIDSTPVIVMDPHGDLINDILGAVPYWRNYRFSTPLEPRRAIPVPKIHYLAIDENNPFGLNLYECNNINSLVAVQNAVDNVVNLFKRVFAEEKSFYPRIERILRATAHIIVMNQLTMAEVPYLFVSREFREQCMEKVTNPQVHQFWYDYDRLRPWEKSVYLEGAIDRLDKFLSNDLIYRIVSQRTTTVPFKQIFTGGGTLLMQLPPHNRELANFLGSVFLAVLSQVAWEQQKLPKKDRRRVHLYIDEYGRFSSTTSASLLKEGGKLGLATVIAHQTLSDLIDEENKQAELQAGNLILFQLTGDNSEVLVKNLTVPPEEPKIDPRVFVITRDPFVYLAKHGHKNPAIQFIADRYLRPLWQLTEDSDNRYYIDKGDISWGSNSSHKPARSIFNNLFIECMDHPAFLESEEYYKSIRLIVDYLQQIQIYFRYETYDGLMLYIKNQTPANLEIVKNVLRRESNAPLNKLIKKKSLLHPMNIHTPLSSKK